MGEARRRYDARNGVERTLILDNASSMFHVKHTQDVEPILDSIARDREVMRNDGDFKLTHRIPTIIYEQLQALGITEDEALFKAWLNSSDATPWRIWEGKTV
jgi:hypothetical protein